MTELVDVDVALKRELERTGTADSHVTVKMTPRASSPRGRGIPPELGQIVLVLQGGGALGAYQIGVYQALHEAGIEPDWVIGTSIGAINASLIAGNPPEQRLARLEEFWSRVEQNADIDVWSALPWVGRSLPNWSTVTNGIPGF